MHVLNTRNVQSALPIALEALADMGIPRDSRAGSVIQMDGPVTTVYDKPRERVIFWPERDANPFFHFYECLWMMGGRRDVASVARYAKNMNSFSDDGKIFNGAYGFRWRRHFQRDQIHWAIARLRANREDRRVVISMWDAAVDPGKADAGTKDVPCNIVLTLQVNPEGMLDMCVFNRSNDIVWGCYGANAVHFSFLQEFVASAIGCEVGSYWQVSVNWHGYVKTLEPLSVLVDSSLGQSPADNPYLANEVEPYPILNGDMDIWFQDLEIYLDEGPIVGFRDSFFRRVVTPMHHAHAAYRRDDAGRFDAAREILAQCQATDWRRAALEWLNRREERSRKASDDTVHAATS